MYKTLATHLGRTFLNLCGEFYMEKTGNLVICICQLYLVNAMQGEIFKALFSICMSLVIVEDTQKLKISSSCMLKPAIFMRPRGKNVSV